MEAFSTSEIRDQNYSSEAYYLKMALRIVEIDEVIEELAIKNIAKGTTDPRVEFILPK